MRLILASRSPQRRAILERLGIPFEAIASGMAEVETGDPAAAAAENARRKAAAVAARPQLAGATVLGVDTVVALDGRSWGQPPDARAARATLTALAGRTHTVISGLCAIAAPDGAPREARATTAVTFRALAAAEVDWYVATGEWRGRAGGYAIQERGGALVERLDGDWLGVVGLPVAALLRLLPGLLPTAP